MILNIKLCNSLTIDSLDDLVKLKALEKKIKDFNLLVNKQQSI